MIEMVRVNVFDVIQYGYKFSLLSGKNVYWLSNARYISPLRDSTDLEVAFCLFHIVSLIKVPDAQIKTFERILFGMFKLYDDVFESG